MHRIKIAIVLLLLYGRSIAQYTPEPPPVSSAMESQLLFRLEQATTDTSRIRLCLTLSNLYYNKPLKNPADLDKAMSYAQQARALSGGVNNPAARNSALQSIALILIAGDSLTAAEAIAGKLDDSTRTNLLLTLSYAYLYRQTGGDEDNTAAALRLARQAGTLAMRLHLPLQTLSALQYQGLYDIIKGKIATGDSILAVVIRQSQQTHSPKLQYAYYDRAVVNLLRGSYDKALADIQQALAGMKSSGDSLEAGDFYFEQALVQDRFSLHQQALEAFRLSLHYYEWHAGHQSVYDAIRAIAQVMMGDRQYQKVLDFVTASYRQYPPSTIEARLTETSCLADCYLKLKQYGLAEKYFLQEFAMHKENNSINAASFHRMAFFYVETKQYNKARPYLLQALKDQGPTTSMASKTHLQYMWFLVDSAAGDYLSAIRHLSLNKRYDDTVYHQGKAQEIQKLTVQYETENKNQQIRLLSEKDQLQEVRLKQANLVRNITIAGILLLLGAGALFYRQYRQKQLASLVIEQGSRHLKKLVTEKEWLLKEIHHRVKNNLHTVVCLLEIQAEFLKGDALKAIEKTQHRIYAMSLIHQKLYLTGDVKSINMADYLRELINYLEDSFGNQQHIRIELDTEALLLDVSRATPLGLIINEAVSNSIKYAFPGNRQGLIAITLRKIGDRISLEISDNGIGFAEITQQVKPDSLGLKLIKGLSADLNAGISIDSSHGTKIMISFSPVAPEDRMPADSLTKHSA
jgi:two-component system, sensor histidine kinase PdtaS